MVETEMMKARTILVLALCAIALCGCSATRFSWKKIIVDGHMTGVTSSNADNVKEAFGTVENGVYHAPNGKVFDSGVTPSEAQLLIDSQDVMSDLKQVIAHASMDMKIKDGTLPQWFIDFYMEEVGKELGRKVDVGFSNVGGIRVNLGAGEVQKDDIVSMFPFKNHIVYASVKGSELVRLMEHMVSDRIQVVGGVKLYIKDRKLVKVEVGGESVDPDRMYGLATVDFLLHGGDGYSVADYASEIVVGEKYVIDVVLPYVIGLEARGKCIECNVDDRITYLD